MLECKFSKELVDYPDALAAMEARVAAIAAGKVDELLWFLEHPPLYTAGTSAKMTDLLAPQTLPVYHTGRGGQFTYHGPGQRVVYACLDLKKRNAMDVRAYVQSLEQWLIASLATLGIKGEVREGRVGVWVSDGESEKKIAAIGIRIRKWVTYHGICLNVNPDLSHYTGIVPCGIREFGVTSLQQMGINMSMDDVDTILRHHFPYQ